MSKDDTLRPLIEEVSKTDKAAATEITDQIRQTQDAGYKTESGALSDTVNRRTDDPGWRRLAQMISSGFGARLNFSPERRKTLTTMLGGAAGGAAISSLIGMPGNYVVGVGVANDTKDPTVEEAFIRRLVDRRHHKPRMLELLASLEDDHEYEKAGLVRALIPPGNNFEETHNAIETLGAFIDRSKLTPFSRAYLQREYSHHHRYIGLSEQANALFAKCDGFEDDHRVLNVLMLNSRHMNRAGDLYRKPDFRRKLSDDNAKLASTYKAKLGLDIADLDPQTFRLARSMSSECAALKGLYYATRVMVADTEAEALLALDELDEFRRQMFLSLDLEQEPWYVLRGYGEVVWWHCRVATLAFFNSWDKVVERCIRAFRDPSSATNMAEAEIMEQFHALEARQLRSPVWITMNLICAMHDEIRDGTGSRSLKELKLVEERQDTILHHVTIRRAFDALSCSFGRSPTDIDSRCALARVESTLLTDCVFKMEERRTRLSSVRQPIPAGAN